MKPLNRLPDARPERRRAATIRSFAREEVWNDGDEAVLRQLIANRASDVGHATDVVNHDDDAGLRRLFRIDDPRLQVPFRRPS